ncbi:uncharacterized protein TNCV_4564711 [Trichonephila clavipes]|nr:uncharacterized protein TNCV_4564711 [Trichonephila clavipes]
MDSLTKHGCNHPQPSGTLSCSQSFSNISRSVEKYIRRIQENGARGQIWETLLYSPVQLDLSRQIFSAVFSTLTGHDIFQQYIHRIGVKNTTECPSVFLWRGYVFCSPDSLCLPDQHRFSFSSVNFIAKAVLYWAAHREMAYTTHSLT